MAGPNSTRFFEQKQALIKETSEAKNKGMELGNAFNNATEIYVALLAHPEINPTEAAEDIMDWVEFFLGMKDALKSKGPEGPNAEMTAKQAVEETERVFCLGGYQGEPGKQPEEPKESLCSEPQTRKIWVELHRLGKKDETHLAIIEGILGLEHLDSMKDLTRKQASTVIEKLIKMEGKK